MYFGYTLSAITVGTKKSCILYWSARAKDLKNIRVICYRDRVRSGVREIAHSIVVEFDAISFGTGNVCGKPVQHAYWFYLLGICMSRNTKTIDTVR